MLAERDGVGEKPAPDLRGSISNFDSDPDFRMKNKGMNDAQFLALLEKVLPKATPDPRLATAIYEQVAQEVRLINNVKSFEKFCTEGSLPDLEPATVEGFREQIASNFANAQVSVEPSEKGDSVAVEIVLPDRTISNKLKVIPPGAEEAEEVKAKFVPFPVALPEDPGLFWILARRENIGPDEAGDLPVERRAGVLGVEGGAEGAEGSGGEVVRGVHPAGAGGGPGGSRVEASLQGPGAVQDPPPGTGEESGGSGGSVRSDGSSGG